MTTAQRLEVSRGGDGAKASGEKKGSGGKFKKQNKEGTVEAVQGNETEEIVQLVQSQQKKQGKGKGR